MFGQLSFSCEEVHFNDVPAIVTLVFIVNNKIVFAICNYIIFCGRRIAIKTRKGLLFLLATMLQ